MIDKIIPAIKSRTVPSRTRRKGSWRQFRQRLGKSIILETQPSNSPDLIVNDLGFFHSIQQLKEDVGVTTAEGLVEATFEAFDIYPRQALECAWHSIFAVYGEFSYMIPHAGKEQAQRKARLPKNGAVDQVKHHTGKAFWRASGVGT
ncbi:unnamed protein product [Discosporangium mesarthrocarpum]